MHGLGRELQQWMIPSKMTSCSNLVIYLKTCRNWPKLGDFSRVKRVIRNSYNLSTTDYRVRFSRSNQDIGGYKSLIILWNSSPHSSSKKRSAHQGRLLPVEKKRKRESLGRYSFPGWNFFLSWAITSLKFMGRTSHLKIQTAYHT